ncbi:histidinol-phosphatase HisJ [Cohnella endophytica]|uniref:Histidinol-phosphatase n=1 Tax=Cohnella endophytica TaxID=2419778 RepID=A0A494XRJ9_9BACL|nr:histidinol-phosphatase HisJ [Cohnella endophytica]RKP50143.1 histidinol-phosphatase HisJ [Cohnella endophytica]
MPIDYHTHNYRCGHAVGELEEYVLSAIGKGMVQIGLSDHMPLVNLTQEEHPDIAMPMEELPRYVEECFRLKEKYKGTIDVRVGLEGDYIEGYEEQIERIANGFPWDYVIGSVHFLGTWDVTDFRQAGKWEGRSVVGAYEQYFDAIQKAAATGLYDFIGHIDAIKRFAPKPPEEDVTPLEEAALQAVKKHDIAFELNAAGFYAPCKEMYPSERILTRAKELEIPVTYGSDAHHPDKVGQKGADARTMLKNVGFTHLATFDGRKRALKPF